MNSPLPSTFILGTQRSGTTLLTRILTSHPAYFVRNEGINIKTVFETATDVQQIAENFDTEFRRINKGVGVQDFLARRGASAWA